MNYPFICPKCNTKETIIMPMIEYTANGHYCKKCGTEMIREISSMIAHSIDKTGTFFRKYN